MTEPTPEARERHRKKVQQQLDDALAESFPASDPVSIVTSQDEEDGLPDSDEAEETPKK